MVLIEKKEVRTQNIVSCTGENLAKIEKDQFLTEERSPASPARSIMAGTK